MPVPASAPHRILAGMFVVAGAILVMQVALSRLLSVLVSYHSAFLVTSLAMLGLTASAIDAYAKKLRHPEAFDGDDAARAAGRGALILAASLLVMMQAGRSDARAMPGAIVGVLGVLGAFHQGGYVVAFLLDRYSADVSRVYFADLVGAAAGCGVAVFLLGFLPAPAVMLACAAAIAASGLLLARSRAFPLAATLVVAVATVLAATTPLYRVHRAKDESQAGVLSEHWNRLARVTVIDSTPGMERSLAILRRTREVTEAEAEQLRRSWRLGWGASGRYTGHVPATRWIQLDADAGTAIVEGGTTADLGFLEWDVTSAGHHLRRGRIDRAFVIGGGGGRDVLTALHFGARHVDVVEINPAVVDVVRHEFPDFVRAPVYDDPRVSLTVGEGRSVLARSTARYDLIQMSLVDTWAASLGGAMVMSENTLYTREAFGEYIAHLDDDGILAVSRWYDPEAGRAERGATWAETMRLARMVASSLREAGIARPEDHVALVYAQGFLGSGVCTVIASRAPLGDADKVALGSLVDRQGYEVLWPPLPGAGDDRGKIGGLLREEAAVVDDPRFDLSVPSDERPFFFNVRRPFSSWMEAWREGDVSIGSPATGMLAAALLFLGALGLVLVTRPLRDLDIRIPLAPAVYFGGLGVGFMAIEMALIQRYIVFLGHPTYALSVVLSVLLLGSGLGSALSGRWRSPARLIPRVVAGIAGTTMVSALVIPQALHLALHLPLAGRVAVAVAGIMPQALFMGMMWPLGVRLLAERGLGEVTPWMWATNGFLGVLASVVAVFVAMVWGYTAVLVLAAGAYLVSAGAARRQW